MPHPWAALWEQMPPWWEPNPYQMPGGGDEWVRMTGP